MEESSLRIYHAEGKKEPTDNSAAAHLTIVVPGEYIAEGAGLTAGHGTFESKDINQEEEEGEERPLGYAKIYASVAGVVHKIDNWIGVKPLKQGYKPDIGDVVVARIVQVQKGMWTCDINSYQHAVLKLTSIQLPSGEQRRRSEEDQLAMRSFFKENELISAEVQQVGSQDGKITLQMRPKNGKLYNGFMFKVDSNFVRRQKIHIHDLSEYGAQGVSVIVGMNGYIWVQPSEQLSIPPQLIVTKTVSADLRTKMSIVRNGIVALEKAQIPIFRDTIAKTLESITRNKLSLKDILKNIEVTTKDARDMIQKEINAMKPQQNMMSMMTESAMNDFIMRE